MEDAFHARPRAQNAKPAGCPVLQRCCARVSLLAISKRENCAGGITRNMRKRMFLVGVGCKIAHPARRDGGAGGIRTLDTAFQPYNGLANRRLQPLGHSTTLKSPARERLKASIFLPAYAGGAGLSFSCPLTRTGRPQHQSKLRLETQPKGEAFAPDWGRAQAG
jgi:hypothetical protein